MSTRLALCVAAPSLLLVACAIPTDETTTPLDPDGLPPAIVNTTTTTTTTTTTIPQPPVSGDSSVATTTSSTTTLPPTLTAPVVLYYTIGSTDAVRPLQRELAADPTLTELIAQLSSPLPDVAELGLRSSVRPDLIESVTVDRGTATVALNPGELDRISDTPLRRAISQLVLTLTSFRTPDQGAIGTVRFETDGEGFAVDVPAFGGQSDPGEPLAFTDFASLVAGTSASTTTTTEPPTSTEPPTTAA